VPSRYDGCVEVRTPDRGRVRRRAGAPRGHDAVRV